MIPVGWRMAFIEKGNHYNNSLRDFIVPMLKSHHTQANKVNASKIQYCKV